jgi:hypothetical protein
MMQSESQLKTLSYKTLANAGVLEFYERYTNNTKGNNQSFFGTKTTLIYELCVA